MLMHVLPHRLQAAGVEDRGLVYQAEGGSTSLLDAIRNYFLKPAQADGETKVCMHKPMAIAIPSASLHVACQGAALLTASAPAHTGGAVQVVHRIAVFEAHGEITNIISQTGRKAGSKRGCPLAAERSGHCISITRYQLPRQPVQQCQEGRRQLSCPCMRVPQPSCKCGGQLQQPPGRFLSVRSAACPVPALCRCASFPGVAPG